jgi:LURP-one-related
MASKQHLPPPMPVVAPLALAPVVSPQFCAPYMVALTIIKKTSLSGGDFVVTDVNGATLMKVTRSL